jgi:hypothetical protein
MTRSAAPQTSPIETALAEAAQRSQSSNREILVVRVADGSYRLVDADKPQSADETLIAMVGTEGETLMYALRMVA